MLPVARTKNLLIQEIGNELIVYDQLNMSSHLLNPLAALVWRYCNGNNSINEIATLVKQDLNISELDHLDMREVIDLTLEELERCQLIENYIKPPIDVSNISRRKVVKTAILAGGLAIGSMFPLVKSIVAPQPAMASSPFDASDSIPPDIPRALAKAMCEQECGGDKNIQKFSSVVGEDGITRYVCICFCPPSKDM
jgi:hypothetical protein